MQTHARKLLVIICEAALERDLIRDARRFGAAGYTITDVRGGGPGGEREAEWEADRSIEVKVICDAAIADAIAGHLLATYSANYSLVLYFSEVSVVRPDRY